MEIVGLKVLEKTSKKGNTFKGLYAITKDGKEIFVCYVNI